MPHCESRSCRANALAGLSAIAALLVCGCDDGEAPWVDHDTDGARILPLGDSITQGDAEHQSYRYPLWTMLVDEGLDFDLVGSRTGNHEGDPVWPDHHGFEFDRNHEGHWGWHADQLLDELPSWLELYDPQIVLLHAGTNDAFNEQPADEIAAELAEIIEVLRDDVPNVAVLLARPIPTASSATDEILEQLCDELDELVATLDSAEAPVVLVDLREGFDADEDTYDGIHPNEGGEQLIAERWFEALLPYL
jgi:lysophospholipase L1-like esterase